MASWLEAINSEHLELLVAGVHYAATQSADEENRQDVRFIGGFGSRGPVARSVRRSDEATVSFSAILLEPGQGVGMDDETTLLGLRDFKVSIRRGADRPQNWHIYEGCAWTTVRVSSTLESVTLNCDMSVPGYTPPSR